MRQTSVLCLLILIMPALGAEMELSGSVGLEARYFTHDALHPRQGSHASSLTLAPEWYWSFADGDQSVLFAPYLRLDNRDAERRHGDVRELIWHRISEDWELRVGIGKVFWGVTESQHLVDIVNQTDLVENPDGEDKLGQPMIDLTLIGDWGNLDIFILPYFRERRFPGPEGRLRSQPYVDRDQAQYESSREEKHVDFALRYTKTLGDWDLGLSYFDGTSRDPLFLSGTAANGDAVLIPLYKQIQQVGLDLQATKGGWLWKLEAIHRRGLGPDYTAATAGFEYTLVGLGGGVKDLGILVETMYDERGTTQSPFEDDSLLGLRWIWNDIASTEMLFGVIFDHNSNERFYFLEASRRLNDRWKINLEARGQSNLSPTQPLYSQRTDDYIELGINYYF